MLAKLNDKFEKNANAINRNDVISLIINSFSKIHVPTAETSQAALQLIVSKTLSTPEQVNALSLQGTMDLSIFLQQSSKKIKWLRQTLSPLLQERVAAFNSQQLEVYVRKIINLETTTPNSTPLQAVQAKNILEALAAHPQIASVQSYLIYQLATRIVKDAKSSGQGTTSSS